MVEEDPSRTIFYKFSMKHHKRNETEKFYLPVVD